MNHMLMANPSLNTRAPDYREFRKVTQTDLGPVPVGSSVDTVLNQSFRLLNDGTMLKPNNIIYKEKPDVEFGVIKPVKFEGGLTWLSGYPDIKAGKPNMPVDFALAASAAGADADAEYMNYVTKVTPDPVYNLLNQMSDEKEVDSLMKKIKLLTEQGFEQEEIKAAILGMRTAKATRIANGAKY